MSRIKNLLNWPTRDDMARCSLYEAPSYKRRENTATILKILEMLVSKFLASY